jgi:hypothetical protein
MKNDPTKHSRWTISSFHGITETVQLLYLSRFYFGDCEPFTGTHARVYLLPPAVLCHLPEGYSTANEEPGPATIGDGRSRRSPLEKIAPMLLRNRHGILVIFGRWRKGGGERQRLADSNSWRRRLGTALGLVVAEAIAGRMDIARKYAVYG